MYVHVCNILRYIYLYIHVYTYTHACMYPCIRIDNFQHASYQAKARDPRTQSLAAISITASVLRGI